MKDSETAAGKTGESLSRREVMVGAGIAIVASASLVSRVALAQSETPHDVSLLNGLLASEYNAIQAYEAGADILNEPPPGDPLAALAPVALAIAAHFQGQHRDHATQLAAVVRAAGATPVVYDDTQFYAPPGFTPSVGNVLRLAANAERRASILYTRALGTMTSRLAAEVLASIGGVETQHFIVLSMLAQGIVAATDMTLTLANDLVPESFVLQTAAGTTGLEQVPDFDLG